MANAKMDENHRPTIIAVSNADGLTVTTPVANAGTHALQADDGTAGSSPSNNLGNAMLDENSVAAMTALSSTGDGTIIGLYATPDGKLLITSA